MTTPKTKKERLTWPKSVKTSVVPLYSGLVAFCNNREDYETITKFIGQPNRAEVSHVGLASHYVNDVNGASLFLLSVFDDDAATIVHESAHIAMAILNHVGINAVQTEEAFCYLLEWIYGEAVKKLFPSAENKEKNGEVQNRQEVCDTSDAIRQSAGNCRSVRTWVRR